MSRFTIHTAKDTIECDEYLVVNDTCIEVGYMVNGKFVHETVRSDYLRIIDSEPEFSHEDFMEAAKLQADLINDEGDEEDSGMAPPLDTAHKSGETHKKPVDGQLLYENSSFYA